MELLVEQGILAATTDGRVRRYGFAHRKSKESVAARIRETDKPFMHQRLAQSWRRSGCSRPDSVDPGGVPKCWRTTGSRPATSAASCARGGSGHLSRTAGLSPFHGIPPGIVEAMPAEALQGRSRALAAVGNA